MATDHIEGPLSSTMDYPLHRRATKSPGDMGPSYIELESSSSRPKLPLEDPEPYGPTLALQPPNTNNSAGDDANELDEQLPLWQAVKRFPKVVAYCGIITIAIIGWGFDLVIVGSITAVDSFLEEYGTEREGELIIPSLWLSLWLALPPAGSAAGSVAAGWLLNKIGRKRSLTLGSVVSAAAIGCIFFSHLPASQASMRAMLTAGMTVQGFAVGIIKTTCITYVSENAPTSLRGPAMALFPTFTLTGQLIGAVVNFVINGIEGPSGYLGAFGSQWILAVPPFVLSLVMPESPSHLLRKGDDERALHMAARLYAPRADPRRALRRMRAVIEEERALEAHASYRACLRRSNARRTLIVVLANLVPAFFGLDLLSNASYFLRTVGMDSSPSLLFMIGGIVAGMVANGAGIWILSRAGRRSMTLVSLGAAGVLWAGMGVTGFFPARLAAAWAAGGFMIGVIVVSGMGSWPASYAVTGEASSLQLRAPTQGIGQVAQQAGSIALTIVLPFIFNPDAGNLGAKTGFLFTGLCLVGWALCWAFLPEMKDRSIQELDRMFEVGLPARKFKGWRMDMTEGEVPSAEV